MYNTNRYGLTLAILTFVNKVIIKQLFAIILFFIYSIITIANPISDLQIRLKDLLLNIEGKEKSIKRHQNNRHYLLNQLKKQENNIITVEVTLNKIRKELLSLRKEVTQLNQNILYLQQKKNMHELLLAKQIYSVFRLGQQKWIEVLLLKGVQEQQKERILAYYNYLNKSREQIIIKLKQIIFLLIKHRQQKQQKQSVQKQNLTKQVQEKKILCLIRDSKRKTLLSLESIIESNLKKLAVMRYNESQLYSQIVKAKLKAKIIIPKELQETTKSYIKQQQEKQKGIIYHSSKDKLSFMTRTGGLGHPVGNALWPIHGKILHHYGDNISNELLWKGMVIKASEGAAVKAISAGRVLLANWLQGYGLVVVIDHGHGDMSLYGYNQSALVNVGQQVRLGQPVALVGSSEGKKRSSLYFEIRREGKPVNPQYWLGG